LQAIPELKYFVLACASIGIRFLDASADQQESFPAVLTLKSPAGKQTGLIRNYLEKTDCR
jgi:hypothetical protein